MCVCAWVVISNIVRHTRVCVSVRAPAYSIVAQASNNFLLGISSRWAYTRLLSDYFIMHFNFIWKQRNENERVGAFLLCIRHYKYYDNGVIVASHDEDGVWKLERDLKIIKPTFSTPDTLNSQATHKNGRKKARIQFSQVIRFNMFDEIYTYTLLNVSNNSYFHR